MSTCSFSRDWDYTTEVGTGAPLPSIVLPAIAGVAHALTAVAASFYMFNDTAVDYAFVVNLYYQINGGSPNYLPANLIVIADTQTSDYQYVGSDEASWTGTITTPPGASLTINTGGLTPAAAGYALMLEAQGYDF